MGNSVFIEAKLSTKLKKLCFHSIHSIEKSMMAFITLENNLPFEFVHY